MEENRHLRTIARLVVAPPFRARGVGSALVRAYLRDPLTEKTEALAAMGPLCPVFERTGMRRVERPPGRAEARVIRLLRERNVRPWMLADARVRGRLARDATMAQAVRTLAIDRWRAGRDRPPQELLERLWPGIAARPHAYVFESTTAQGRRPPAAMNQTP
jgi:GNAT superfamily N-acetyltransferase